jgi:hypothetical protein
MGFGAPLELPDDSRAATLRSQEKRQGQNRPSDLILYEHHQSRIVEAALFSQLPNCALGIRKCCRNIRQVPAIKIILDPVPSADREKISLHRK